MDHLLFPHMLTLYHKLDCIKYLILQCVAPLLNWNVMAVLISLQNQRWSPKGRKAALVTSEDVDGPNTKMQHLKLA